MALLEIEAIEVEQAYSNLQTRLNRDINSNDCEQRTIYDPEQKKDKTLELCQIDLAVIELLASYEDSNEQILALVGLLSEKNSIAVMILLAKLVRAKRKAIKIEFDTQGSYNPDGIGSRTANPYAYKVS